MNTEIARRIQRALIAAGYSVGKSGADGDWGRESIAALAKFQRDKGLKVTTPGTIALVPSSLTVKALGIDLKQIVSDGIPLSPPWLAEAMRKLGLHEKLNNSTLKAYLKQYGGALGDPAKLPWCGDFVETVIAKTLPQESLPTNPYYALNWSKFGVDAKFIALGNILTFRRQGGGHVGFCVGHDKTHFHVLGGNQSNAVTVARVAKDRLDAMRWPKGFALPSANIHMTTINATITRNEA